MPERPILLLYATIHGHTALLAERIATELRARGYPVEMERVERLPRGFSLERYAAVLLGGPVYRGRFPKPLRDFAAANHARLERLPSAFFSVGLSAAGTRPEDRALTRKYFERFARDTGWNPREFAFFAGAVSYTSYSLPLRWWMRFAARSLGARDLGRDYVFTDWLAVQSFAELFADQLDRLFGAQLRVPPEFSPDERPPG